MLKYSGNNIDKEFSLARYKKTENIIAFFKDFSTDIEYSLLCFSCIKMGLWQHVAFIVENQTWKFMIGGKSTDFEADMGFVIPLVSYDTVYTGTSVEHQGFGYVDDFRIYDTNLSN